MLITTMSFEVRGAFIKNAHDHKKCATCRIDYRVNDKCAGSVRAMLSGVLVVCPGVPCCVACLLCGVPCSVACYHCYVHVSATLRVVHDHARQHKVLQSIGLGVLTRRQQPLMSS